MSLLPSYLFFLRTTWRNRALQFGRRIRSPRYAIALVLGITYFFFAFGGPKLFGSDGGRSANGGALIRVADTIGPFLLLLFVALWWFYGKMGQALHFTPAEANLLVPAPLTRRQLIQFKLLNAVPGTLLTALMFTLISRGAPLGPAARFASLVVLFGTLRLHQIAATLVRSSLAQQGRTGLRNAWPAVLAFAAIVGSVAYTLFLDRAAITATPDAGAIMRALAGTLSQAPASIAMAPFTAALAPVAAKSLAGWPVPFAIAIAILIAHYIWVIRMDAAFEEGAVAAGAAIAARVEAVRQGRRVTLGAPSKTVRAPWFPLPSEGEPAYAIWWKNILQVTRGTSRVMLVLVFFVPAFLIFFDNRGNDSHGIAMVGAIMLLVFGAMATILGPLHMRNDLRGDLRRIELLRTLPVGGSRLVAAEVAASTLTLTAVQVVMFAAAAGLALYSGRVDLLPFAAAAIIPLILLLIAVNGTMVLIHNGFALLFPAWANLKRGTQGPGVENFGQNILIMVGTFLLFALSFVAPLLVAAASGGALAFRLGAWAGVPAAFVFVLALYLQAAGIIAWLGRVYDRIDPVEAGLCD
ncbi:MAG TPA: putative ABC exporter domain-containing protein [Longimicrobiales bacterium]